MNRLFISTIGQIELITNCYFLLPRLDDYGNIPQERCTTYKHYPLINDTGRRRSPGKALVRPELVPYFNSQSRMAKKVWAAKPIFISQKVE